MLLSRRTQRLALGACVVSAGCSSPVSTTLIADELVALTASDSICAVGAAPAKEASRDFARMVMVMTRSAPATGRFVLVKVDSLNRPREFLASVSKEVDHTMRMQSAIVSFDASGNVSNARSAALTDA